MGGAYNEVTPFKLGKSRGKKRNKSALTEQQVEDSSTYIPAPPAESPPPVGEPPKHLDNKVFSNPVPFGILPQQAQSLPSLWWNGNPGASSSLPGFGIGPNIPLINLANGVPSPSNTGVISADLGPFIGNQAYGDRTSVSKQSGSQSIKTLKQNATLQEQRNNENNNNKRRRARHNGADRIQLSGEIYNLNPKEEAEKRRKRAEKFSTSSANNANSNLDDDENFANLNAISTKSHKFDKNKRIVGLCQNLEKSYLRLTSEPNPNLVRPLSVLKKTYALLINKHKKKKASYQYLCDQFKSMRQDLRVQMIENQFTVKVYEAHARIALENGDIGEFNQCQSRLIALFELPNIKTSFLEEFTSYRILYYMLTENHGHINMLRLKLMTKNKAVFSNHMVKTSFDLAHASLMGDYHNFMRIYASLEPLGKKLVDAFIDKESLKSLATICKSYNQINLDFLATELKFDNKKEVVDWLHEKSLNKFIVTKNPGENNEFQILDTKACRPVIVRQYLSCKKIDIKGQQ